MSVWRVLFFISALIFVVLVLLLSLSVGSVFTAPSTIFHTLTGMKADNFEQASILYQRLPRCVIALYVGAVMACSGLVFQGLIRNPLASSSTLGVSAGATLFVVVGAVVFKFSLAQQGFAALCGGVFGFVSCLFVARLAGFNGVPRGLLLILAGTLITMLYFGISNAVLLANPSERSTFLSWIAGNINHVYIHRFYAFSWIGVFAFIILFFLARPLTLSLLGQEKATSMGISSVIVSRTATGVAIIGASSAVAICGPISFVGLVVPHIVRPLIGQNFALTLPACALVGAAFCALADLCARVIFQPYILSTGVFLDFLGGIVFIFIVRNFYLSSSKKGLL